MNGKCNLSEICCSNHPAKPYLVAGTILAAYGLIRSGSTALAYLLAGGVVLAKGLDEIRRSNELHGGNHHGANRPSVNT